MSKFTHMAPFLTIMAVLKLDRVGNLDGCLGCVGFDFGCMFPFLPDSAWTDENVAELA